MLLSRVSWNVVEMSKRNNKYIGLAAGLVGLILPIGIFFGFSGGVEVSFERGVQFVNRDLPKAKLVDSATGEDFSEEVRKGKVLLIYLSSRCDACIRDARLISNSQPEISSKIKIYGISFENKEVIKKFVVDERVRFPVLIDSDRALFSQLEIKYFPTKFYAQNGTISKILYGNFPNKEKFLEYIENGDK